MFAWNDYAALQVVRVLRGLGLAVPDDVSVVGYDDYEVAELALPLFTTVRERRCTSWPSRRRSG